MTRNKTSRKKSCEDKSLFQKIFGKVDELLHTGIDVFTLFPYEADFGIKSRFVQENAVSCESGCSAYGRNERW